MSKSSTKAQTLKLLENKVTLFTVPELLYFDAAAYKNSPVEILEKIQRSFQRLSLAVRSSALGEDSAESACAGEYESLLNVPADDAEKLSAAIDCVLNSYAAKGAPAVEKNEVIIQKMVNNTIMSGVIFTHDLNTGAPYYVINYDDVSGSTHTVTSGAGEYANRTLYIHRGATKDVRSERFKKLLDAVQELEIIMESQFLDIEFAIDENLTPYLLQVRAITTQPNWNRAVAKSINQALSGIQTFVRHHFQPVPNVFGASTIFGQMPDWNPAEMIGRAPRALAFSLYKTLITDNAWRIARKKMGYSVPVGQPLMVSLAGQPFIDTRLSFHSFLPAGISPEVGHKLVDRWILRLKENPQLHDKVEFDIAITTFSFDMDKKMQQLVGDAISTEEAMQLKELFRLQAVDLICGYSSGSIKTALQKIEALAKKQKLHKKTETPNMAILYEMVDDCINLGTVSFSILARHGFIAQTLLFSMKEEGLLSAQDVLNIQSSVHTVAGDLVAAMRGLHSGDFARDDFMEQYGHLRPGTYDILSPRYDQMDSLGTSSVMASPEINSNVFSLSAEAIQAIDQRLVADGFGTFNAQALLDYVKSAIEGREYGKFVFTRTVSDILQLIAKFGEQHGLSHEEMSHIPIERLFAVLSKSSEKGIEESLRLIAEDEAEKHAVSTAIRLPQVLFDEAGVHVIPFQVSQPNFITHKKITAESICLVLDKTTPLLSGKIVLIENADPGFDWIFSQKIEGLITKYGGANSHMAIRCAEFGIPAAIGCGEQRFESIKTAHQILLDCSAGLIKSLH